MRAASTHSLRGVGAALQRRLNVPVEAVSLLHSSGVPEAELGGQRARLLEPALLEWLAKNPEGEVVLLPLFFGPSGALTDYLPERLVSIRGKYPRAAIRVARWLVDPNSNDTRIAEALVRATRAVLDEQRFARRPQVILVDHGSPQPGVAAVRNHLCDQVELLLGSEVERVGASSMERRPGPEYSFNDPLLSVALTRPPFNRGDVVVLLQFLSPGRHAGPAGDVAEICDEARRGNTALRTYLTEPIASDPAVVEVLVQRYEQSLQTSLRGSIKPTSNA